MFGKKNVSGDKPKKDTIKISKKAFLAIFVIAVMGSFIGTALFVGVAAVVVWDFVLHGKMPTFPNGSGSGSGSGPGSGGSCTTNCGSGGSSGCTTNCQSSNIQSTSNGVTLTLTKYGFTSNSFNGTFTITQSRTLNSVTINANGQSCSMTAPSGQGLYADSSKSTNFNIQLSGSNGGVCSGSLTAFQSGMTYSFTIGDTNGDSFNFSVRY